MEPRLPRPWEDGGVPSEAKVSGAHSATRRGSRLAQGRTRGLPGGRAGWRG